MIDWGYLDEQTESERLIVNEKNEREREEGKKKGRIKRNDREGANGQNFIVARYAKFRVSRRQ